VSILDVLEGRAKVDAQGYPRHVVLGGLNNPTARPEPFDKAQDKLRAAESKDDSH